MNVSLNSVLMSVLSVFAALLSAKASASDCNASVLSHQGLYEIPGVGYWMQASGDCRVTYTGVGGFKSQMYNMCTRQAEPISGRTDAAPIPAFEGEIYTHPGLTFYRRSEALATGGGNSPFYTDNSMPNFYQSIGILGDATDQEASVRVAIGWSAGRFRDYRIRRTPSGFSVAPISPVTSICRNLPGGGLDHETPMLSRDGLMIAGRDRETSHTRVYRIESPSWDCLPIATIRHRTSKVSFSFDNQKVAYVAKDPNSTRGRLFELDIATGETRTLSGPNEDVLYTTHKSDGTILYTRRLANQDRSQLVALPPRPQETAENRRAQQAIGLLWARRCSFRIDLDSAEAVGRRIRSDVCARLASPSEIERLPDAYKGLTEIEFRSVCSVRPAAHGAETATERRATEP